MDADKVYLLQTEKEVWDKGTKLSTPSLSYVAINDFLLMRDGGFYEKEQISVEILHDPTMPESAAEKMKVLKDNKEEGGKDEGGAQEPEKKKVKADYVKEYAELMEIAIEDVDAKMTVKELQAEIETIKASKE